MECSPHQFFGGILPVATKGEEIQTISTNNQISRIFLVLAVPMNWWVIPASLMFAAPRIFGRTSPNFSSGESGKRNLFCTRSWPNLKRKQHPSPRFVVNTQHLPPSQPSFFSLDTTFKSKVMEAKIFSLYLLISASHHVQSGGLW